MTRRRLVTAATLSATIILIFVAGSLIIAYADAYNSQQQPADDGMIIGADGITSIDTMPSRAQVDDSLDTGDPAYCNSIRGLSPTNVWKLTRHWAGNPGSIIPSAKQMAIIKIIIEECAKR